MHIPLKVAPSRLCPVIQAVAAPAVFLAGLLTFFLQVQPFTGDDPEHDHFFFETSIDSSQAGVAYLFADHGIGFEPRDAVAVTVQPGAQIAHFVVRAGSYSAFRFIPLDRPGEVHFQPLRIVTTDGRLLRDFKSADWSTADGAAPGPGAISLPGGPAASVTFRAAQEIVLRPSLDALAAALQFAVLSLTIAALLWKLGPWWENPASYWKERLSSWREAARAHPQRTLFFVALAAVLVSCHPIIFCGRSFVSPNNRTLCLYDNFPTIPGSPAGPIEDPKGSDLGAMMWAHLPYSVVQHRTLFEDGEVTLWDRFEGCGIPLLGQGQSMLGDPLHWIPLAAGGAAWAWDVKFVLAKFLFAFGIGLLVRAAVSCLGIAALLAASSAFIGFFAYRFNHAAFFSLCYAPWILLAWLKIAQAGSWRGASRAAWLLLAAHWSELQSGTAKESSMLLL